MKFKSTFSVVGVFSMVIWCAGCAGGKSSQVLPGVTALQVTVHAESKTGWQDPSKQSDYMAGLRPGEAKAFETIDYSALGDIVVWVEPASPPGSMGFVSSAGNISINLGATRSDLIVSGRGSIWDFRSAMSRAEEVYLREESGRIVPLGPIAGPGRSLLPDVQGLVEVMVASRPDPIARVYVAPSAFVRVASSNQPINFVALPPGPAKVVAWHARLPGSTVQVNVAPGRTTQAVVTIGVNSLPKAP